ncbi:kinetochore Sim4 complex subunit Fta4 [Fusarium flagelliforme]|uniref:Kinetochore protein fta4 n=1 Tax=Fusarium flagelliforme TaxID=2675880 RepID=A0A395MPH8_9HYPO|nr:kinetochore Sim4 complex subunit Fta4 [Fusarium flagelliforme]KAH7193380.1 kinetochore Sim4 complex subunit Fta4 [Fusarium flagelliforme]RFN49836.1 kinetochore protein fta4 [Fusarium flagelliforme]
MSSRASAPTIPALKQAFLTNQTTLLAQPLAPSRSWQAANDASDEALSERVVEDVLFSLNHTIQQHCRRVYAPQASRNIAEQIDSVYTQDAERKVGGPADTEGGIGRELDLTDKEAIEALPASWHIEKDVEDHPMEVKRYADAVNRLTELNDQRKQLREQVARLKHLQTIVKPLQTTDNGVGIQENLLTRNGPVEKELEKMRFLLARVGGRVHALAEEGPNGVSKEISLSETGSHGRKRRVDQFLADEVFQ